MTVHEECFLCASDEASDNRQTLHPKPAQSRSANITSSSGNINNLAYTRGVDVGGRVFHSICARGITQTNCLKPSAPAIDGRCIPSVISCTSNRSSFMSFNNQPEGMIWCENSRQRSITQCCSEKKRAHIEQNVKYEVPESQWHHSYKCMPGKELIALAPFVVWFLFQ